MPTADILAALAEAERLLSIGIENERFPPVEA
jgi:hypothetical protein